MRDVVQKNEKTKKKPNPRGFGDPMRATEEQQKLIEKKKVKIEKKMKKEFPDKFQAIMYRRTVQGTTDEIIIDVGPDFDGQQVKATVVQKANKGYLLFKADWHTPDEEVEVGQLEVEEIVKEEKDIEGNARVMKKKEGEIQPEKIVEKIEQAEAAALAAAPVQNGAQHMQVNIEQPKKSKKPMQIMMGGSPQPQVVQKPIQPKVAPAQEQMIQPKMAPPQEQMIQPQRAPAQQQMIQPQRAPQQQQQASQPIMIHPKNAQPSYQAMPRQSQQQAVQPSGLGSLLHVTVIDGAYEHRIAQSGQAANEKTYHPRQAVQTPQPHVLFVKTINPF